RHDVVPLAVFEPRAVEAHAHAIAGRRDGKARLLNEAERCWREVVVLRTQNDAEAGGRGEIEGAEAHLFDLAGPRAAQGQAVARLQGATVEATDARPHQRGAAAEYGRHVEAALGGEIKHTGKRADADLIAALKPGALQHRQALGAAVVWGG